MFNHPPSLRYGAAGELTRINTNSLVARAAAADGSLLLVEAKQAANPARGGAAKLEIALRLGMLEI